jgi:hypothetical protein
MQLSGGGTKQETSEESTLQIVPDSVFPGANLRAFLSGVHLLANHVSGRVTALVPGVR